MSKQDRQGVRTINDLERKYYFDRAFSEVMGIANDAQKAADNARDAANKYANDIKGELKLVVKKDENEQIVSMLNASANVIKLKGNRVSIESDNFTLTEDGKITAKKGVFDECTINATCNIMGVLKGGAISSNSYQEMRGNIGFEGYQGDHTAYGAKYKLALNWENHAVMDAGTAAQPYIVLNELVNPDDSTVYTSEILLAFHEIYTNYAYLHLASNAGNLGGLWKYNNSEIATKTDISTLDARLKVLEGA